MKIKNLNPGNKKKKWEVVKQFVEWHAKNKFLRDQISKLEKLKDFPIFSIVVFILKTELIEHELKQLISRLDAYLWTLEINFTPVILTRKLHMPKDLDELTFGKLAKELNQYQGEFLKDLQNTLPQLVSLRNKFIHDLFKPGNLKSLMAETKKGLIMADEVIRNLNDIYRFLESHPPKKLKYKSPD
jgi:hypothetical protein